jgi:KUP system potassium uptake protein
VVLLTVVNREQPRIAEAKRLSVTPVAEGIVRLVAQVGFMEKPGILEILRAADAHGVPCEPEGTTFFLSREELLRGQRSDLPPLRRRAFMLMARSAQVVADYYGLPPGRVIEIGTRLEI